ncbi:Protein O-linked-mannose beta-1,4-N-acetylglucosaminyltransferase 2 [Lobulomyces angularis]|nr:Protein O-linked-mannose beta-1,4-N-acetylglucosaminyltransferase 2 [Lobulomyces angularis]
MDYDFDDSNKLRSQSSSSQNSPLLERRSAAQKPLRSNSFPVSGLSPIAGSPSSPGQNPPTISYSPFTGQLPTPTGSPMRRRVPAADSPMNSDIPSSPFSTFPTSSSTNNLNTQDSNLLQTNSNSSSRRSSMLAFYSDETSKNKLFSAKSGSNFDDKKSSSRRKFILILIVIAIGGYLAFTVIAYTMQHGYFSFGKNHKADWQVKFEELKHVVEQQKGYINKLHEKSTSMQYEHENTIKNLKANHEAVKQEQIEKLLKTEKILNKKIKEEEDDELGGVGVWKPKPVSKKKKDNKKVNHAPSEKLENFQTHKLSENPPSFSRKKNIFVDERDEFIKENLDGLTHKQREEVVKNTDDDDATIIAAQHALENSEDGILFNQEATNLIRNEDDDEEDSDADNKPRRVLHWKPEPSDISPVHKFNMIPSSSVYCEGDRRENRICRFKNLCYEPKSEKWFISQTNRTIQRNVPIHRHDEGFIELSTISGHNYFYWDFDEVSPFDEKFRNIKIRFEKERHFMFSRLHPANIMHNLHDETLGLYHLIKEFGFPSNDPSLPFSLDGHRLMVLDIYERTDTSHLYDYLANKPTRFRDYLNIDEDVITCFEDAVLGSSKIATWYQYGFTEPQSVIPGKILNGNLVREVGEFLLQRAGLPLGFDEYLFRPIIDGVQPIPNGRVTGEEFSLQMDHSVVSAEVDFPETNLIVIFTRRNNRIITNQAELEDKLHKQFGYEVVTVNNENMSFEKQLKILRRARVLVGMHGSILILGMFCRRGTVLVELFPFGVPAKHYTPYKVMSELPGMNLIYRAWENKWEANSRAYPERHELHGGIQGLSEEMRKKVLETKVVPQHLCCSSPFWLYRIYQDTTVIYSELAALIEDALKESRAILKPIRDGSWNWGMTELLPSIISDIECLDSEERPAGELWAEWSPPWNGAKVDKYSIHVNNNGREYTSAGNVMAIAGFQPGEEVVFFVRPLVGKFVGEFGRVGKCIVNIGTKYSPFPKAQSSSSTIVLTVPKFPSIISHFDQLETLILTDLNLAGSLDATIFKNLTNLKYFSVYNNLLIGNLVEELFIYLKHLILLDVGENKFSGTLPQSITNLQSMIYLGLENNQFTGPLPNLADIPNLGSGNLDLAHGGVKAACFLNGLGPKLTSSGVCLPDDSKLPASCSGPKFLSCSTGKIESSLDSKEEKIKNEKKFFQLNQIQIIGILLAFSVLIALLTFCCVYFKIRSSILEKRSRQDSLVSSSSFGSEACLKKSNV